MKSITHSLKFVTELDETNSTSMRLLALTDEMQVAMLEGMLRELLIPALEPIIAELNANNSFATLKVAD